MSVTVKGMGRRKRGIAELVKTHIKKVESADLRLSIEMLLENAGLSKLEPDLDLAVWVYLHPGLTVGGLKTSIGEVPWGFLTRTLTPPPVTREMRAVPTLIALRLRLRVLEYHGYLRTERRSGLEVWYPVESLVVTQVDAATTAQTPRP